MFVCVCVITIQSRGDSRVSVLRRLNPLSEHEKVRVRACYKSKKLQNLTWFFLFILQTIPSNAQNIHCVHWLVEKY